MSLVYLKNNSIVIKSLLTMTLLGLSACGGGGDAAPVEPVVKAPSITDFGANKMTIVVGDNANLTADFMNGSGKIDNGIGSITSNQTMSITPTISTTYTLTVTNSADVSVSQSITITVLSAPPPLPVINSFDASQVTISFGDSVDLTAVFTDGIGTIDNGVGSIVSNQPVSISPLVTTTYQVTVSNSVLDIVTRDITITVIPPPAPTIMSFNSTDTVITAGSSTTLTAVFSNGVASIDNGVGAVVSTVAKTITPTVTTTYELTVTNQALVTMQQTVVVTVVPAPTIGGFVSTDTVITAGSSTTLTAVFSNGVASVDNGVGAVVSTVAKTITPTVTTTYELTVTNQALATQKQTVVVTVVPAPAISSFVSTDTVITAGSSTTLTAVFSNGIASVDNGVGAVVSTVAKTITPTVTTTYELTVTNQALATQKKIVVVTVVPAPTISSFVATVANIVEGDSVDLTALFSNGSGSIDNGVGAVVSGSSVTVMPTSTTTYLLTVTNTAMSTISQPLTITVQPLAPIVSSFTATQSTITVGDSVELTAVFSNGTGAIDNGVGGVTSSIAVTVTPAISTTYNLTVTNSAGVFVTDSVPITVEAAAKFALTTGAPIVDRTNFATTLLSADATNGNGQVLVTGGFSVVLQNLVNNAELYDPITGLFSATTGVMGSIRRGHTSTLLANGKVLITGGDYTVSGSTGATASAELYDPVTKRFSATGNMTSNRYLHTATVLTNGDVLMVGGFTGARGALTLSAKIEVYNVATGKFTALTAPLNAARRDHRATTLDNGSILICGGADFSPQCELFDQGDNSTRPTGSPSVTLSYFITVKLNDGTVLLQQGSTAEIYDPVTGLFTATGSPQLGGFFPRDALLLANGNVLIAAGGNSSKEAQVYNPISRLFRVTANTLQGQYFSLTATRLYNDEVLILGSGNAEIYK